MVYFEQVYLALVSYGSFATGWGISGLGLSCRKLAFDTLFASCVIAEIVHLGSLTAWSNTLFHFVCHCRASSIWTEKSCFLKHSLADVLLLWGTIALKHSCSMHHVILHADTTMYSCLVQAISLEVFAVEVIVGAVA